MLGQEAKSRTAELSYCSSHLNCCAHLWAKQCWAHPIQFFYCSVLPVPSQSCSLPPPHHLCGFLHTLKCSLPPCSHLSFCCATGLAQCVLALRQLWYWAGLGLELGSKSPYKWLGVAQFMIDWSSRYLSDFSLFIYSAEVMFKCFTVALKKYCAFSWNSKRGKRSDENNIHGNCW